MAEQVRGKYAVNGHSHGDNIRPRNICSDLVARKTILGLNDDSVSSTDCVQHVLLLSELW